MIIYKAEELNKFNEFKQIIEKFGDFSRDYIELLTLLEKINPCNQFYELREDSLIISYDLKLNCFNFKNILTLKVKAQIIGLPISLSEKGCYGDIGKAVQIIKKRKGLKIILNSDLEIVKNSRTLSTFVFENNFTSFDDYISSLRSSYRRRIKKALGKRDKLIIRKIENKAFNENHYKLYLSIMKRTENPLETLPMEFFKEYKADIYEFVDKNTGNVLGFIQLKKIGPKLCFLFGGFNKEDLDDFDLYYNMLLKIVEIGIEMKVKTIEFGQTAEESKLKIGCKEVNKYLYAHHSNFILNYIIQKFLPYMSYKPYNGAHHVFKE